MLTMSNEFKVEEYKETLKSIRENILPFGNSYLDEFAGGIFKNDLVVIGASSGAGKSEQGATIALHNAKDGNKIVYLFALEAFKYEIEARSIFRLAMEAYYKNGGDHKSFTFYDYLKGETPSFLTPYISDAEKAMKVISQNLKIIYIPANYTISMFEQDLSKIDLNTNLIILDHLHYFELDGYNENREVTKIMKKIRDLVLISGIPIILISHVRKNNMTKTKITLSQEDLHGTSNIAKIATKIITITPDFTREPINSYTFPTWLRIAKNRYNGAATRFCASMGYSLLTNKYSSKYFLHKLNFDETEASIVEKNFPKWCKSHMNERVDNWSL